MNIISLVGLKEIFIKKSSRERSAPSNQAIREERMKKIAELDPALSSAEIGKRFFVFASKEYPASLAAQSSAIAIISTISNISPEEVGNSLLQDENEMNSILNTAVNVHARHEVDLALDMNSLKRIVNADFQVAAMLRILQPSDLHYVLNQYDGHRQHIKDDKQGVEEDVLRDTIRRMLKGVDPLELIEHS